MADYPFERFTQGAKIATKLAEDEARRRGCDAILPGHVTLALLRCHDEPGMASTLGTLVSIDEELYHACDRVIPRGGEVTEGRVPMDPSTKEILVRALVVADGLHSDSIGTEHLLIAVAGGADPTGKVLAEAGADRDTLMGAIRAAAGASTFEVRTTQGSGRFRRRTKGGRGAG